MANDPVNHPDHYTAGNIECIDAIKESMSFDAFCGYLKGNSQKYLWRYQLKNNPVEDLKKAQWYLNKLIETSEKHSKEEKQLENMKRSNTMNFTLGTYGPRQVYILGYSMTDKIMTVCLHNKDEYAFVNHNAYTAFSSNNKNATTSIVLNHQQAPKILDDYIAHPNKYGFIVILPDINDIKKWFSNYEVMSEGFENPVHIDINNVMRIVKPVCYEETFESIYGDVSTKIKCEPYTLSSSYEWSDLYFFIRKLLVLAQNPQVRMFYDLLHEQIANSKLTGLMAPSLKNIATTEMISYTKPMPNDLIREQFNSITNKIRCILEFGITKSNIGVPMIDRIIFNNPSTIVFWTDGTKTVVTAMDGDEFSKEYGLAMAIAKKYFSCYDSKHPRAVFKKAVEKADDYSDHTIAVKERHEHKKLKQLEAAKKESENVTEATDISE